jgi:hypothetical protein
MTIYIYYSFLEGLFDYVLRHQGTADNAGKFLNGI